MFYGSDTTTFLKVRVPASQKRIATLFMRAHGMKKSSQIVHGNPAILGTKIFTGSTRFQTDGAVKSESTRLEKSVLVNSWISSGEADERKVRLQTRLLYLRP